MGYRRIITRVRDEAGNIHGADAIQVTAVEAGLTAAVTAYLDSAGAITVANPHRAFPGTETQTAANAVSGDDTVQVSSTTGFTVGDFITIDGSGGKIRRAVRAILAGPARLQFEKTLGVAMNTGATVGGKKDKGLWAAYVVDDRDYETIAENTGTGQVLQGPFFPYLSPSAAPTMPNLIPNSDVARRTKLMTFMPEVFADTSGWTADLGSLGSVASNLLTPGTASNGDVNDTDIWRAYAGLSTWRDIRISVQFQLTANESCEISMAKFASSTDNVRTFVNRNATTFALKKVIGGTHTNVASGSAFTGTVNDYFWLELESQGTSYIGRLYSSGASAVAKSSATLLQSISGTISDAAVATGRAALITRQSASTVTTAPKFGGLSTGDGGLYVEALGPESWSVSFTGTKGGQAVGFDESADAGPLSRQWAVQNYIPATSRGILWSQDVGGVNAANGIVASTVYACSLYEKVSGLGGSGAILFAEFTTAQLSSSDIAVKAELQDAGETSWTRKTATFTSESNARRLKLRWGVNYDNSAGTTQSATGTLYFLLPQLEQSQVATQWRNAPEDVADMVWQLLVASPSADVSTATGSYVEPFPRDLAANIFLPWDATVRVDVWLGAYDTGSANDQMGLGYSIDGTNRDFRYPSTGSTTPFGKYASGAEKLAAGKHRIAAIASRLSGVGTLTLTNNAGALAPRPFVLITATKGK